MQSLWHGVRRLLGGEEEASLGGLRVAARDAQRAARTIATVDRRFHQTPSGPLPFPFQQTTAATRRGPEQVTAAPGVSVAAARLHARPAGAPLSGVAMEALLQLLADG